MGSGWFLLLLPETEPGRELPAQPDHFAAERRLDLFVRQAMRRSGDAQGSDHLPGIIPNRGGDAPQPFLELLEIGCVAPLAHPLEVTEEFIDGSEGLPGVSLQI